jgi:hypothetical protein
VLVTTSTQESVTSPSPSPTMTGAGNSAGSVDSGASLRLDSWHEERKGGQVTIQRLIRYIGELLGMQTDLLAASASGLSRCLSMLDMRKVRVGKAGSMERALVLGLLEKKRDELHRQLEVRGKEEADTGLHDDDSDAELEAGVDSHVVSEDVRAVASTSPSAPQHAPSSRHQRSLVSPSSGRPRRQGSVAPSASQYESEDAVSDAEIVLVELLLSGEADPSRVVSLSPAGAKLLRSLKRQRAIATPSASAATGSTSESAPIRSLVSALAPVVSVPRTSTSTVLPVRAQHESATAGVAAAARRESVINRLPLFDLSRAAPRVSSSMPSMSFDPASRQVAFNPDPGSDSETEPVSPGAAVGILPPALSGSLVRMGVLEELAVDDALLQTSATVYPSSYQSFWASRETSMEKRLYYEGLVLSMLLDLAANPSLLLEVAARRWLTLSLVASGCDWASAQAWLPLSRTNGVTARQVHLMGRFARATAVPGRLSSSTAPASYKTSSSKRQSSRRSHGTSSARERSTSRGRAGRDTPGSGGGGGSSNGSSNGSNSNKSNNSKRRQRGAGSGGQRAADVPSASGS